LTSGVIVESPEQCLVAAGIDPGHETAAALEDGQSRSGFRRRDGIGAQPQL
jgi:hypothetical protein